MKKHTLTLVILLIVSSLLVAGVGAVLKYGVLKPLGIRREEGIMELPFVLMADKSLSYQVQSRWEAMRNPTQPPTDPPQPPTEASPVETIPETELPTEVPTEPPTQPTYAAVDESWFDDVLFIGDSRTMGMRDMARLGDADYFCASSMTVFSVTTKPCSDEDFYNKYLTDVLESKTYGKIYVHLGLNECGNNHELVMEKYRELIGLIREKQPDAVIILQAIMSVTRNKASNPDFSLKRINNLNEQIAALAEDDTFRYIDTNGWITDEEGYMISEKSRDGCHLYGTGYIEWSQWILENAGSLGIS
ncbi:MAG: hypothetical protein J6B43_07495 [Lachnospiraceae bacterium]|nr:hypothetical protein [Lachnospiraceae bacterium]